jgi:hypothetical protein
MTQILLEEYIFIAGAMKDKRDLQKKKAANSPLFSTRNPTPTESAFLMLLRPPFGSADEHNARSERNQ